MSPQLDAELRIQPERASSRERFVANGALVNHGGEPLTLDINPLSSPSLALEMEDTGGSPLRLPPPPVPTGESNVVELLPNERYDAEYAGFLPQWTSAGKYRARLRYPCLWYVPQRICYCM